MNHVTPLLGRVPRTLRGSVMLLPLACVVIAGCSGNSSSAPPKTQPPAASPTQSAGAGATPAEAAKASPSAPACYDTCGKTEPVIFFINSTISADNYDGVRPSTIDLSVDTPNSNVVSGLSWSSWASGTNGQVPAGATAKGTGKLTSNGSAATVTITLSDPINGDPTLWGTLTEQIPGKQPAVYHYNGMWATSASGGQQP